MVPLLIYFLSTTYLNEVCKDNDNGKRDKVGNGCAMYNKSPFVCGIFDDDDFSANSMCCACKGKFLKNCFRKCGQSTRIIYINVSFV